MTYHVMDTPDLDLLLDRARSGDESAFAGLYRDLHPRMLRYLQVQTPELAEDVAADTWLDVARALGGFDGDAGAFRSWVFAIARNRLVDAVRRAGRRPLHLVEDSGELEALAGLRAAAGYGPGGLADPASDAETYEATQRAVAMVRTLPPDQAEVVMLRVIAGLEPTEVALLVGKPVGSVRVLAHRGLRRLARTLAATEQEAAGRSPAAPSGGHQGEMV